VRTTPGLGNSFTYRRARSEGVFDKTTGKYTATFWESPTVSGLVMMATVKDVEASKGRLQIDDRAFVFSSSAFTSQGAQDLSPAATAADEIVYGGQTFLVDLGGGVAVIHLDESERMWTVWGRRRR